MSNLVRWIGRAWAAPVTLLGLLYAWLFASAGWYDYVGLFDEAIVWELNAKKAPWWLCGHWRCWSVHVVGQVVVLKVKHTTERGKIALKHGQAHVHQFTTLGILQPVCYALAWLLLQDCQNVHPSYDNIFEIDARRAAGQVVDITGVLKRALAAGYIKLSPKPVSRDFQDGLKQASASQSLISAVERSRSRSPK